MNISEQEKQDKLVAADEHIRLKVADDNLRPSAGPAVYSYIIFHSFSITMLVVLQLLMISTHLPHDGIE